MEDEYRIAKFKVLIQKVNKFISKRLGYGYESYVSEGLRLVFDFQTMNKYAQLIKDSYSNYSYYYENSIDNKISMVTEISKQLKIYDYGRSFLFWALMVLAVDDTDKEKHLSLICDFARMLEVTDDEMKDMVNVIKRIFKCGDYEPVKTQRVRDIFYRDFWDKF